MNFILGMSPISSGRSGQKMLTSSLSFSQSPALCGSAIRLVSREHSADVKYSVSARDIVGIRAQAGLEAGVNLGNDQGTHTQHTMHVAQEEIFAVAHCVAKLKPELSRNAPSAS